MQRKKMLVAILGMSLLAGTARADSLDFVINGGGAFNVNAGAPADFNFANVPVLNGILGYTLSANWTDGGGAPYSSDLVVQIAPSGAAPSGFIGLGGADDSNPFVFPGAPFQFISDFGFPMNNAAYAYQFGGVTSTNGAWTVSFDTLWGGSTANLANAVVTVYYDPFIAFTASTQTGNTFDRPEADGSGLSGEIVEYQTATFSATVNGRYFFAADFLNGFDGFMLLYENVFDPNNPLTNLIAASDDSFEFFTDAANFSVELTAGTSYTVVYTAWEDGDSGAFNGFVVAPSVVPEPTTLALGALGAAGMGLGYRRLRMNRKFSWQAKQVS